MFITEDQNGDQDKSAADAEEAAEEPYPATHHHKK
jgi:hypothetical protein